jgi:hypothetical protein
MNARFALAVFYFSSYMTKEVMVMFLAESLPTTPRTPIYDHDFNNSANPVLGAIQTWAASPQASRRKSKAVGCVRCLIIHYRILCDAASNDGLNAF